MEDKDRADLEELLEGLRGLTESSRAASAAIGPMARVTQNATAEKRKAAE